MLLAQGFPVRNGEIEVQLHRHVRRRPCGALQAFHQLESQHGTALNIGEDQPVNLLGGAVGSAVGRRFVAWPVSKSEKLPVELGQSPDIRGVQDGVQQLREFTHGARVAQEGQWFLRSRAGVAGPM